MTRDEAIKIFHGAMFADEAATSAGAARDLKISERAISAYIALGMLKLDDPRDEIIKRARDAILGLAREDRNSIAVLSALEAAGLKIVEA